MYRNLFKYLLVFLSLTVYVFAVDDDNDLNLQKPNKLNRVEGQKDILESVKKDEVQGSFKLDKNKDSMPKNEIDTSNFKKVKLIDAVLETLSHSDLLKSSREKVIQYELKVKSAMADFYPTLNYEYTLGRTKTSPSGTEGVKFKYYDDRSYKLVLKQNIYAGGASDANLESVIKRLEVSKNQYRIVLDDEIKKAIKAYFDVVFANRSVMVNERNMKKLNKILKIVTIKYDNGAASIGDLTSIKANVANAMTKLVKVKSKFIEALRFYEYIVGTEFNSTLPFEKNFDVNIGDFEEVYKRALKNNRDLINYYRSIEVEKFNKRNAEASFRPKVDFELSYERTIDAEDQEEQVKDLNGKVKVTYNIFNGGRDKNKVLEKSSAIRDLKYRLSEEEKKLRWNLSKIHTSITSVSKALESTVTEIIASRKMVSSYWDAFKLGEQDLNTLLQGQRQLNSAETELVKYEKSHVNDFFNILELTGDLSAFFDVDPENPKFIDFSKSNYKKTIIAKDGEALVLDKKEEPKKEEVEPKEEEIEIKEIPLPQPSIDENINNYIEEFKSFDDDSFMILISNFTNIYSAFDFIKENEISKNSFSFDVLDGLNIKTKIAHNNFNEQTEAEAYIEQLKEKDSNKEYEVKKVSEIRELYKAYIDGIKIKPQEPKVKIKTKIKVVEKVRQKIEDKEFTTDEVFKEKFLSSDNNNFTINISTFTDINKLENFVNKNEIYTDSFFFKYGSNGQLVKLLNGIFENYEQAQNSLNILVSKNENIFPIIEKIGLVKKLYEEHKNLNKKVEVSAEYEFIDITRENKQKYPIAKTSTSNKKQKVEEKKAVKKESDKKDLENIVEQKAIKKDVELVESTKEKEGKTLEIKEETEAVDLENIELNDFEKRFLEAPRDYYTTNLAAFDDMQSAKDFVELHNIEDNTILVVSNSGKIMVMSGVYSKRADSLKAIEELPIKIKRNKPFIQKIFRTQESFRKNNLNDDQVDLEKEKAEQERLAKEEAERVAKEKARLEEIARKETEAKKLAEQKALEEAKKAEELRLKKLEEEKIAKEKAEQERLAKEEAERVAKEKARLEEIARKEAEAKKLEEERLSKEEAARVAKEKARLEEIARQEAEAKKIAEQKALEEAKKAEELRLKKLEEERIAKEKVRLEEIARKEAESKKLAEQKALEEAKKAEELRLKKLEEEKIAKAKAEQERLAKEEAEKVAKEKARLEEIARKEAEAKKLAEQKALEEAKKVEELRLKKLEEEKIAKEKAEQERLAKEEAERLAKEKERLAEQKALEEARKEEEIKLKKLEERLSKEKAEQERLSKEKARLEEIARQEAEAKRLAEQKALGEAKKAEELRLKKLEEERIAKEKAEQERLAKEEVERKEKARLEEIARQEAEAKRLAELKALEEAKKAEELRLKKLEEERIAKEKAEQERLAKEEAERVAEEKARLEEIARQEAEAKKLVEQKALEEARKEKVPSKTVFESKAPVEEIDFALPSNAKKRVEIPYAKRLELFKDKFYKAANNQYTLKLTRIESNKVKWYTHRFGLDPNYVVIVRKGKKSDIYYGVFNSVDEARKKTETLHPLIYESKPPVKKIGSVR